MRLRCSVPTLDAKDSRENEDLPEDCDQCRRQTGKQRSEEDEEQEGTEVRRRCDDGGVQYMARPPKHKKKHRAFNTAVSNGCVALTNHFINRWLASKFKLSNNHSPEMTRACIVACCLCTLHKIVAVCMCDGVLCEGV